MLRRPTKEDPTEKPLARVSYDLIDMAPGYNVDKRVRRFRDNYTSMDFVYTHRKKSQATKTIKEFLNMVETRYNLRVQCFLIDGERSLGRKFDDMMVALGITTAFSAPATLHRRSHRAIWGKGEMLS
jgi:hypothetical protein